MSQSPEGCRLLVLVTYRSLDLVGDLIETVRQWVDEDALAHVALVENSHSQETVNRVRAAMGDRDDRVVAVVADRNLGFAPAVNIAISRAEATWGRASAVILLNPDVSTSAATIAAVLDQLADTSIGISAPLLVDDQGRNDRGSARRYWNLRRLFAEVVGAPRLAAALGAESRAIPVMGEVLDVDITSGAFMAIRRDVVGDGLDTRLPMYLEDQEICHRARQLGYRVTVFPKLIARHSGASSRKSNTTMQRELRMMELATAPALSLRDVDDVRQILIRATVGCAGLMRLAIGVGAGGASIVVRHRREWSRSQVRLSTWFLAWATRPNSFEPVRWDGR